MNYDKTDVVTIPLNNILPIFSVLQNTNTRGDIGIKRNETIPFKLFKILKNTITTKTLSNL